MMTRPIFTGCAPTVTSVETPFTPARAVSRLVSWIRSQTVALTASAADFGITILLTELARLWYTWSNAIGATCGAVISFTLCRRWAFRSRHNPWPKQAWRYLHASLLSAAMNTAGVWWVTEQFHLPYVWSKVIVATFIGMTINFVTFRYYVFR